MAVCLSKPVCQSRPVCLSRSICLLRSICLSTSICLFRSIKVLFVYACIFTFLHMYLSLSGLPEEVLTAEDLKQISLLKFEPAAASASSPNQCDQIGRFFAL